jgi:hypothetical protein
LTEHDCADVDEIDGLYVLRCACGWQSSPARSAEAVGGEWDAHRVVDMPPAVSDGAP